MKTNYDELIPRGVIFNLKEIEEMNIIKIDMAKKLISKNEIEVVKIGNKLHISRSELIRYLDVNFTFMFPVISLLCFHLFHSKFPRGNKV